MICQNDHSFEVFGMSYRVTLSVLPISGKHGYVLLEDRLSRKNTVQNFGFLIKFLGGIRKSRTWNLSSLFLPSKFTFFFIFFVELLEKQTNPDVTQNIFVNCDTNSVLHSFPRESDEYFFHISPDYSRAQKKIFQGNKYRSRSSYFSFCNSYFIIL